MKLVYIALAFLACLLGVCMLAQASNALAQVQAFMLFALSTVLVSGSFTVDVPKRS